VHSETPFYIDEKIDERLSSSRLVPKDVLINIVGATLDVIGRVALVPEGFPRTNITQAMSLIRCKSEDFLPEYVFAFMRSRYGRTQVCRIARPTAQFNMNHEETRIILIPKMPLALQEEIMNDVSGFHKFYKASIDLYLQAEALLLEELDLTGFQPKYRLSYRSSLAEAFQAHRLDAEFFQPFYEDMIKAITKKGRCRIQDLQLFNRRGVQPIYTESGATEVVRSEHLGRTSLDYEHFDRTTQEQWEMHEDARVYQSDILTYATGAYVGRTNCFLEERQAVASNHVNILRVKNMKPLYVSVFLNSVPGQMQLKRYVSGSAQAELYPSGISSVSVWTAPDHIQERIASLVKQSHCARSEATKLLQRATTRVEQAIEDSCRIGTATF